MDYGTAGTALASGVLFGYVLEQAGFGSPCKLTGQFRLTDWSVFKVMFTAIIVAAIGILLLQTGNYFGSQGFYVPTTFFWATAIGGALIGAGMALGGYCPGTSVVGMMSGRIDGLVFIVGMVAGVWGFAGMYDASWMQSLLGSDKVAAKTLPQLLGVSPWVVVAVMVIVAVGGFWLGRFLEQRSHGVYDAEDIAEGTDPSEGRNDEGDMGRGPMMGQSADR